jgi:nucleotidyltransferase/DNA polymerase involved in DNA repair
MLKERLIVHVDMDAFFASIEARDNPALMGRAVIVGADPKGGRGRGVVSTCSYEARKLGIHSAMPISLAYRICPHAVYLPVDMKKYESVSREIYSTLYSFTPDIEPVSIDEAFLDITGTYHLFATPLETCRRIKEKIRSATGLTASLGIAPTKMAAKIASDIGKPDGMVEVKREGLQKFLAPLSVRKLWGLGEKTERILEGMGIATIGELAKSDVHDLVKVLGINGEKLWLLAKGVDTSEVETERETKSLSGETTFDRDTADAGRIEATLLSISEILSGRLRREGLKSRTVTLKIRLEGYKTYTRAYTMDGPTNYADAIYAVAKRLYEDFDTGGRKVRLVGVRASGLLPSWQKNSLFTEKGVEKMEGLHRAVDRIKTKFGEGSIYRAAGKGA